MKPPTHISKYVKSVTSEYNGRLLNCEIGCSCGNQEFQILYHGETHLYQRERIPCTLEIEGEYFFIVKVKCVKCGNEHLLFDKDFHGWDGCVCHDEKEASNPRPPLIAWKCLKCNKEKHFVQVEFCYGDEDGPNDAVAQGIIDNPADAFEWIYINIKCENCGLSTEKWVDYETA